MDRYLAGENNVVFYSLDNIGAFVIRTTRGTALSPKIIGKEKDLL